MRRILIIYISLVFAQVSIAQSIPKLMELADTLYQANHYLEAIEFYDKISSIDKENYFARYRLGFCYNRTLQYEKAKDVFLDLGLATGHEFQAQSLYYYANVLKLEGNFEVADSIFESLIALPSAEPHLIELSRKQKEGCLLAMRQEQVDRGFTVEAMEDLNSKYHDFGAIINPSNKELVFATTRNLPGIQYEGSQYEGLLPDLVAFRRTSSGRWRMASSQQHFSSLNTHWSEGSGTFTHDGNTFYYSSCRGEDGTDCAIMVSYLIDGDWSRPAALNQYINEPGSENKQPNISQGGDTLFFSSDRPGGFGGSDIWMSLKGLGEESWTPAINMGEVINTPENEITPYYSSAYNCLLFASNGHVGYGGYDLFAAKGESFFEPEIYNLGYPFNSTLDDTYFAISDTVGFLSSNRADRRLLNLYSFPVSNEKLFLSTLISGESLIDSRIIAKYRSIQSLDLTTFRVEDYQGYDLFEPVKREKPKPPIVAAAEPEPEEDSVVAQLPVASLLFENKGSSEFHYEKLYFDFGESKLRRASEIALEDLARQLADIEFEEIDILAFTDSVGNHDYNLELSETRGNNALNYLMSLGIPSGKLRVLARGEHHHGNTKDDWLTRVLSRKVEVVIKSKDPLELRTAKTYLVRQNNILNNISNLLGVGTGELEKMNGPLEGTILAGSTLRIPSVSRHPYLQQFLESDGLTNSFFTYRVRGGETLASIADKYGTLEELLAEINQLDREPLSGERIIIYKISF